MYATVDFSPAIISSLEDKLDIAAAYPIVQTMTPQTIELFVGSVMERLLKEINDIMQRGGEALVERNDALGLALLLLREGIYLPSLNLLEISREIIKNARCASRWIIPLQSRRSGSDGGLYYCKMFVDVQQ